MSREFFCKDCRLLFWEEYQTNPLPGYSYVCPSCGKGNENDNVPVWATDSIGFTMHNDELVDGWPIYYLADGAPPGALKHYETEGISEKKVKPDDVDFTSTRNTR